MFTESELQRIKQYLKNTPKDSKIYLGCDSQKHKKNDVWYASYAVVLVIHINSKHGCKIFGYTEKEPVYDSPKKPRMRLMSEIYKVVDLYNYLADELEDFSNFECEIHLDVNADPKWTSNIVMKEALGYVRGMTGLDAKIKPDAWSASYAADWLVRHKHCYE
jgi:predicted RNase H-related nuclease YkuK (DUF458 family)